MTFESIREKDETAREARESGEEIHLTVEKHPQKIQSNSKLRCCICKERPCRDDTSIILSFLECCIKVISLNSAASSSSVLLSHSAGQAVDCTEQIKTLQYALCFATLP